MSFLTFKSVVSAFTNSCKYAKLLMINHPKLPLKNIANEVGYYDYYHFSKMFKKFVGCSPTDFRDDNK